MIYTLNVNHLTKRDHKHSTPFEQEMKVALDRAGLTQTTLAINLGIGQSTVNNYYKRPDLLIKRGVPFTVKFIRAHQLSEDRAVELARGIFGAKYDSYLKEAEAFVSKDSPIPQTFSKGDLVSIRDLGTIQAGLKGLSYSNDDYEYTNVHKDDLNGYNPSDCFRVTVTGDSMISDEVARRITPGSKAIFHILTPKMQPRENDIVAVWLRDEDIGVIKTYHKNQDFVILNSFNKHHRPIIIDDKQQGVIQGILVSVTQMFRS